MASKKSGARKPRRASLRATEKAAERLDRRTWDLRLYVAGQARNSQLALSNLTRLCEEYIPGRYRIEIIDLVANPQLAKAEQILAIPTLVRKLPVPVRRLIGDLSNAERAIVALDLRQIPE